MTRRMLAPLALLLMLPSACSGPGPAHPDAALPDAAASDAVTPDAAPADGAVPGEVALPLAVPGAGSVTLTWQDPATPGLAAIEVAVDPPHASPPDVAPGAERGVVEGLADGTEYTFTLRARGAGGQRSAGVALRAIPGNVLRRADPRRYRVTAAVGLRDTGQVGDRVSIVFPFPQSNVYQDVDAVTYGPPGEVLDVPGTDDRYLRFLLQGDDLPTADATSVWSYTFELTVHTVTADASELTPLLPYDTSTELWARYTGASGEWVVPDDATILGVSADLWSQSADVLDYAHRAYDWVADHLTYRYPHGNESLADVLASGGGDCGCLSAVYASLLRAAGIPARHVVARRPDNGHAWTDLYLQGHGWIPQDVTAHVGGADHFGLADYEAVIQSFDQHLPVEFWPGEVRTVDVLQSRHVLLTTSGGPGELTQSYSLTWEALP